MDLKNRLVSYRWAVGAAASGGNKNIFPDGKRSSTDRTPGFFFEKIEGTMLSTDYSTGYS